MDRTLPGTRSKRHEPGRRCLSARRLAVILVFSAAAAGLCAGCSDETSSAASAADAKRHFEQGDYKTAVVHLRNALAKNPLDRESLLLLGRTYAALGNHDAAVGEFSKVWRIERGNLDVVQQLAQSYLKARKYEALLAELKPEASWPDATAAAVLTARGRALAALKRPEEARNAYGDALKREPEQPGALLGLASLAHAAGDLDRATGLVERALAHSPELLDAWMMKGDLLVVRDRHAEAAEAFRRALAVAPDHVPAMIGSANSLTSTGRFDEARRFIDDAARRQPKHPMVQYARAVFHHARAEIEPAQESIALALKYLPDYVPALVLSGSLDLRQRAYVRAAATFGQVVKARPHDTFARALHAVALIRANRANEALATLQPALGRSADDRDLLVLAAEANMALGRHGPATEYLERAARRDPGDAGVRRGLAMAQRAAGDDHRAAKEFDAAMKLGDRHAEVMFALSLLGQRQFDKALRAAHALQAKDARNPIPYYVAGLARLGSRDATRARGEFQQALALDGSYFPAARELACMDFAAGRPEAARERLAGVLAHDKTSIPAMLSLSELAFASGKPADGVAWLERARAAAPENVEPRLRLARHYLAAEEVEQALVVAAETEALQPDNPAVLDTIAAVRLAKGDIPSAITALSRLVRFAPDSPIALQRLGAAQSAGGRHAEAEANLARALALKPDYVEAAVTRALNHVAAGRIDDALAIAAQLRSRHPKSAAGASLEGDVLVLARRPEEAAKA